MSFRGESTRQRAFARRQVLLMALVLGGIALWAATQIGRSGTAGGSIVVSLRGNVATTLDPANLSSEAALERQIAALAGVRSVLGPATLIERQAAQTRIAIRRYVAAMKPAGAVAAGKDLATVLVHYGYIGLPSLANQSFVGQLIFGSGTAPERRFAAVFPDGDDARVTITLGPRGSDEETRLLARIERLVAGAQLQGVKASL
jgi:hypothetical protein